ncbi:beta-xylosidase family glycoside hydrolase, partial [[Kitasatospora] papulosa]
SFVIVSVGLVFVILTLYAPGAPEGWPPTARRGGGPDTLRLGYETEDGHVEVLAELDGRYLTTEVAGGFTGRVIGMYATRGEAAFDWFELRPA